MDRIDAYKGKELLVVPGADAVIEPEAVVIEAFNALVARSAVLGRWMHPLRADLAVENFSTA